MRGLLLQNIGWKLLSAAIAVILWFVVVGEPRYVASVSAPLNFRNVPEDLEVSLDRPDSVTLEVRGPSGSLDPSDLADAAVLLDLASVDKPGQRTFTFSQANVVLPTSLRFVRAVPSQVRLQFERKLSREVPVQVRFSGPPPAGFGIKEQYVLPASLLVTGPASRVNKVESAETDPIDLAGVTGRREFLVNVFVNDPQVRFESASEVAVSVVTEKLQPVETR